MTVMKEMFASFDTKMNTMDKNLRGEIANVKF